MGGSWAHLLATTPGTTNFFRGSYCIVLNSETFRSLEHSYSEKVGHSSINFVLLFPAYCWCTNHGLIHPELLINLFNFSYFIVFIIFHSLLFLFLVISRVLFLQKSCGKPRADPSSIPY